MPTARKYVYDPDNNAGIIHQFLDVNGDESGATNFNGNYSVTPITAYIQPPAGEVYVITHLLIAVTDNLINVDGYGNLSALSNGYDIQVVDSSDTLIVQLSGSLKINTHLDLATRYYHTRYISTGTGSNSMLHNVNFEEDGQPVILKDQQKLRIVLNDDFTGLVDHSFYANGYKGYGQVGREGVLNR